MAEATRPTLILGSSSPRRLDLLKTVGLAFAVLKPETEEKVRPGEQPYAYALRNSVEKAAWVTAHSQASGTYEHGFIVISADTIVVLDDDILEKPRDPVHAAAMLQRLSGRTHKVISGVTLESQGGLPPQRETFAVVTEVRIKPLTGLEIQAYIRTGEPLDKSGGYGAQGIGSYMVESVNGSYTNVVGLPVAEVVECLGRVFGYPLFEGS